MLFECVLLLCKLFCIISKSYSASWNFAATSELSLCNEESAFFSKADY